MEATPAAVLRSGVARLGLSWRARSVSMEPEGKRTMHKALASNGDAEIILKLYELRTEEVMRKARAWLVVEFWPETADDFFAVLNGLGSQHNAYLRQVTSYWEMASALVLHGAVSADLYLDTNGEGFFILAKLSHILPEILEQRPAFMAKTRRVIDEYQVAAQTFESMKRTVAKTRAARG